LSNYAGRAAPMRARTPALARSKLSGRSHTSACKSSLKRRAAGAQMGWNKYGIWIYIGH
jgi:hypothetical protein